MPEGTVFLSVEEKDRVHLTRTSDTSCMIEGDSDDERKTRVHLILVSREAPMFTTPRDFWNPRVYHWTAVQNSFKLPARRILCRCGLLKCGNAGSCYCGDVVTVYQRVFVASQSLTFVSISTSTR